MVPRPRAPKGPDRHAAVGLRAPLHNGTPSVALTRTPRGWTVIGPSGADPAAGLVEGMTLADLIVEELGGIPEPERSARRSARGALAAEDVVDPRDARIAALERTVVQLEHALAARVATERAIGLLVERYHVSPREAFDALRSEARAGSRPVQELARMVMEGAADLGHRLRPALRDADLADGRF